MSNAPTTTPGRIGYGVGLAIGYALGGLLQAIVFPFRLLNRAADRSMRRQGYL